MPERYETCVVAFDEKYEVERLRDLFVGDSGLVQRFEAAVDAKARADEREKLRELVDKWSDESRDWYYAERHTHENGIDWVAGFESGWDHAASLLLGYLTARNGGSGDDG